MFQPYELLTQLFNEFNSPATERDMSLFIMELQKSEISTLFENGISLNPHKIRDMLTQLTHRLELE
jgi:hypothetical protein